MKKLVSLSFAVFIFFCMLVATERQAFAYVDPSTGFMALQGIASAVAAFGYFMRRRIVSLFTRSTPESTKNGDSAKAA